VFIIEGKNLRKQSRDYICGEIIAIYHQCCWNRIRILSIYV